MNLQGLRVLVVEDEPVEAMMIEEYLEDLGCTVVGVATRLDEALKQANTLDLDVGVLDVNLSGKLSYPVAEVLKGRAVKFVFATGYGAVVTPANLRDAPVLASPVALKGALFGWSSSAGSSGDRDRRRNHFYEIKAHDLAARELTRAAALTLPSTTAVGSHS